MIKIAVGLPAYRNIIVADQALTWMDFGVVLNQHSDLFDVPIFQVINACGIERVRNFLTANAIEADVDWLLMLDSDNFINRKEGLPGSEALLRMIKTAHEASTLQPTAIIAAPYKGRSGDTEHLKVSAQYKVGKDWFYYPIEKLEGYVSEVEYIATGCCAVNIQWLKKNWPEGPWWVSELPQGFPKKEAGNGVSEDFYFCREARAKGGKVVCDGRFIAAHRSIGG